MKHALYDMSVRVFFEPMTDHIDNPNLTPEEEQEKFKKDAIQQVKINAFHMHRALDKLNLQEALKFGALLLGELRTNLLSPQKYYELYIKATDELHALEQYFAEEVKRGSRIEELYEVVQHAGNVVPRMYLLITVGSVYIKSKEAPAKDILRDLVEMCKGVQHPTRGLFLRNYLSHVAKNKLPDSGNEYEGVGGTVQDSVEFILQNFHEMVRLWVRMETKGIIRDKDKRERERKELQILVGFNLVRLSQLEGVDLPIYCRPRLPAADGDGDITAAAAAAAANGQPRREPVLDRVLDIIIQCKDQMAQQYLMECIIQVFPDEFHLATLEQYLESCMLLHQGVDLRNIFTTLIDRLARYAALFLEGTKARDPAVEAAVLGMVGLFSQYIQRAVAERPKTMTTAVFVQTQHSLLNLVLKAYPGDMEAVNRVIAATTDHFVRMSKDKRLDATTVKLLKKFLMAPIEHHQNAVVCLELSTIPPLMAHLPFSARRALAKDIASAAAKYCHWVEGVDQVAKLFALISPLIQDEPDQPAFADIYADEADFAEEQNLVARLVHLLHNDNLDVLFKMYSAARKQFGIGGPQRIRYTLVPLVFSYLKLAARIHAAAARDKGAAAPATTTTTGKVMQYVLETLQKIDKVVPEQVLRVYLQAGAVADLCGLEDQAYEALSQAMVLYEEQITDSKLQMQILTAIIATIQSLKTMSDANYDPLTTKVCQYSSKLLKKPDQCQAAILCSHLFWAREDHQDSGKVLDCLQRALKVADSCAVLQQIQLFMLILNAYLYYFATDNDKVTVSNLNVLIAMIVTSLSKGPDDAKPEGALAPVKAFFQATIKHIEYRQQDGQPGADRWRGISPTGAESPA